MFQAPFSFDGRIRRTEFGISLIICMIPVVIINIIIASTRTEGISLLRIAYVPMVWSIWAQGAKRCHDLSRYGFWQPFFFLFFYNAVR